MVSISFDRNKYVFTEIPILLLSSQTENDVRAEQITEFLNELDEYGVIFRDLVNYELDEATRNLVLNIAYYVADNPQINERMIVSKKLPTRQLASCVKISQNKLENWKDYIVAYYLIVANTKYKSILDYFKIKPKEDNKVVSIVNKKYPVEKGLVIKTGRKYTYILTITGAFIKIKSNNKEVKVGEIAEGKEVFKLKKYRIHISILLIILLCIVSGIIVEYTKTEKIVFIQTKSNIKMNVNRFNKVVYVYSPTEKGQKLIEELKIENEDLDHSVARIFEYAVENDMIDKNVSTLITVSGKALPYGSLEETRKVIGKNNISVIINNSGNQQKLQKYNPEEEEKEEEQQEQEQN